VAQQTASGASDELSEERGLARRGVVITEIPGGIFDEDLPMERLLNLRDMADHDCQRNARQNKARKVSAVVIATAE
jgi:hypothetical protein